MKERCDECGSINLAYDGDKGELICTDCGIVMQENISQEQEYERRRKQPNHNIRWNFSSGYQKDKKIEGYKEDPQMKEFLAEIYILESLLKGILEEEWETLKKKTVDFLRYNYDNNLPKTREKRALIWAIIISVFETEIINLENQNRSLEAKKYRIALEKLSDNDNSLYNRANVMRDKLLPIIKEIVQNNLNLGEGIEWETHIIDLFRVDPKSKNIYKRGLHRLFSKESTLIPHQEAGGEIIQNRINIWERDVHNAAVEVARIFMRTILTNEKKIGKKEGLLCACAYLVCKQNDFKPLPLKKWAEFFGVSNRCLKDRVKEIKDTFVLHLIQQPPMELQVQDKKLFLAEKVQKQA